MELGGDNKLRCNSEPRSTSWTQNIRNWWRGWKTDSKNL